MLEQEMRQTRWGRRRSTYERPTQQEDPGTAARRAAFLEVVENQLRENNPPETRTTLQRLMAAGNDREEAMRLIGCVVAAEIYDVLNGGREFDRARYVRRLHGLPAMPWDTEGG